MIDLGLDDVRGFADAALAVGGICAVALVLLVIGLVALGTRRL